VEGQDRRNRATALGCTLPANAPMHPDSAVAGAADPWENVSVSPQRIGHMIGNDGQGTPAAKAATALA